MAVLARVPSGKGSAAFPGVADDRCGSCDHARTRYETLPRHHPSTALQLTSACLVLLLSSAGKCIRNKPMANGKGLAAIKRFVHSHSHHLSAAKVGAGSASFTSVRQHLRRKLRFEEWGSMGKARNGLRSPAGRLYTFEAVGQLLGQEAVPADEQRACLAALLRPLVQQLEAAVAPANGTAAGTKVPLT